jgi:2-polyprenyl-3-methyl-5-hydroxy-6-metoxy-1,4-benzoquinol methylase
MQNNLASKEYWTDLNRTSIFDVKTIVFSRLFNKYLKKSGNEKKIILEIGCVPGVFLGYISTKFGYFPEGIDFVKGSEKTTKLTLEKMGIKESNIYEADFLEWTAPKMYDVVCSFGFIEHFEDPSDIIDKHIKVLKPGGTLILEIPNFTYGQKFLRNILDKENLNRHNTNIMNLLFFKNIVIRNNLKIEYLNYYGGLFGFWWENKNPSVTQKIIYLFFKYVSVLTKKINISNKYFSPYIILIAKKLE